MQKKFWSAVAMSLPVVGAMFISIGSAYALPWVASGSCTETLGSNPVVTCTGVTGQVEVRCDQYHEASTLTLKLNGITQTINCGGICGTSNGVGYCDVSEIPSTGLCDDNALESDAKKAGVKNTASGVAESASGDSPLWTWTCSIPGTTDHCSADFGVNCGTGGTNIGCGGANGGTYTSAPTTGLCLSSCTASPVEAQGAFWAWDCNTAGGDTFNCLASIGNGGGSDGNNGNDGGSNNSICSAPPAGKECESIAELSKLCSNGAATPATITTPEDGPWAWICSTNTNTVACSTSQPADENGLLPASICGTLNGKKLSEAPDVADENLCNYGYLVSNKIYGDGPWIWSCKYSWLTSVCMADKEDSNIVIIGQARSSSLGSADLDENSEREFGSIQLNEYSQIINYNIAGLTKDLLGQAGGNVTIGADGKPTSNNFDQPNAQVYYIKNGNLIFGSETNFNFSAPTTYIVDGGDVIIKNNLKYANNGSVGFIVLQKSNWSGLSNDDRGGNIYVAPNVTDIVGSLYMQGSLISAQDQNGDGQIQDAEIFYGQGADFSDVKQILNNQLYHQGIVISRNTVYGSRIKEEIVAFNLPFLAIEDPTNVGERYLNLPNSGITSIAQYKNEYYNVCSSSASQAVCQYPGYTPYQDFARRFDLNYVRILNSAGQRSPQIQALLDNGSITKNIYNKSFIIRYDNKVQSATPPGFED